MPGPADHPSAATALGLGIAAVFCLGALTGVPAILVGRSVLNAVRAEPGRWRGAVSAQMGIVLGSISILETTLVLSLVATHGWKSAAPLIAIALGGLVLLAIGGGASLPKPLAIVGSVLRRAPLPTGLALAGVIAGSSVGAVRTAAAEQHERDLCTSARGNFDAALGKEAFETANAALYVVKASCRPTSAEVDALETALKGKQADVERRHAEEARVKAALDAAEKEKKAVESFPEKSKQIALQVKKGRTLASQGRWEDANEALNTAQSMLSEFNGTSIEASKAFADYENQIAAQGKAIQPQLDKIAEKRRQEQAALALRAAIRGPEPVNSPWDGSVSAVERAVKGAMHDPSSYEHVRTSRPVAEGDYWVVTSAFRGKNAFGAKVINTKRFYIQQNQVMKVTDVGGDDDE